MIYKPVVVSKKAESIVLVGILVLMLASSLNAMSIEQANSKFEAAADEQLASAALSRHPKFIVMPSSLSRFLFYNTRPYERLSASANSIFDNKRSNSALDMITGVTLGKRSGAASGSGNGFAMPASVDLINMEPIFKGQQYAYNSVPRLYDMRWAPTDTYESASQPSSSSSIGASE